MIEAGKYKGKATELAWVEKTFQGETTVQLAVKFEVPELEEELTWIGHFTDKAKDITMAALRELGYTRPDREVTTIKIEELKNEVTIKVAYKEWQGEQQMRVSVVTPFVGKPASSSALSKLAASLGGPVAKKTWADDNASDDIPF